MNYEFTRLRRRVEELEKRIDQMMKDLEACKGKKKPGPKPKGKIDE